MPRHSSGTGTYYSANPNATAQGRFNAQAAMDADSLKADELSIKQQAENRRAAFGIASLQLRAQQAEGRATALKDQSEAVNAIRQQQADVQAKVAELRDLQTQSQLQKQNYELDKMVRTEKDAAAFLKRASQYSPHDPNYRTGLAKTMAGYPLAMGSDSVKEFMSNAQKDWLEADKQKNALERMQAEDALKTGKVVRQIVNKFDDAGKAIDTTTTTELNPKATPVIGNPTGVTDMASLAQQALNDPAATEAHKTAATNYLKSKGAGPVATPVIQSNGLNITDASPLIAPIAPVIPAVVPNGEPTDGNQ